MRIAIDLQGFQSEGSRKRGIGRYSYEIIKNLLDNHSCNDYILVANSALKDVRNEFSKYLKKNQNISYFNWYSPTPLSFISHNKVNIEIAKFIRSYAFNCLQADIIIVTSFFEGFSDNCFTEFDFESLNTPIVSIFYDLIPLLNPELYLNLNPEFSKYYYQKLELLKRFNALLAISKSSSDEAIKYLKIDSSKIYNISSACDNDLFNNITTISHNLTNLFENIGSFVLYSGAGDPRKNLKNLLKAFSLLSEELKLKYHLVLVGKLLSEEILIIKELITKFKIDMDSVHILGYVSDNDLVALYRKCSLFVFPSFHEGFGLPVLEAMSCEAPVIGSSCTSIPEIISMKEAMFDPHDPYAIKDLMQRALSDEVFLNKLKANSKKQSIQFSWSNTVTRVLNVCLSLTNKSCTNSISWNWENFQDKKNIYFEDLTKKISKIISRKEDNFIKIISSSIDKTNISLGLYFRKQIKNKQLDTWKVEGPFDSSYSLSILNRSFTSSLEREIEDVNIHITEGGGDYDIDINYLSQFSNIYIKHLSSSDNRRVADVVSRNLYPPRVSDMNARINLLHAYGWEESEIPSNWINNFNLYLQGITVMSNQVKKILIDNGLKIPVKVCGLGIDHLESEDHPVSFNLSTKKYKFLHVSSCFPRKGVDILLKSFCENFTNKDDVSLIIKTFENQHNSVEDFIKRIQKDNLLAPDILLIKEDLSEMQMSYLYQECDALVAPSRGEGFGLPIAEAMYFGLPVITTGWGGQLDFCNHMNSFLIDFTFAKSESHFGLDLSYWAEPSTKHLGELMLLVFNSEDTLIKRKVDIAKQSIINFSWAKVARENVLFANELTHSFNSCIPKIGWISTWNARCGIASYSRHLITHMENEIVIYAPLSEEIIQDNTLEVIPSWELNSFDKSSFDKILANLVESGITTLTIQFNYGFFQFDVFSEFILKVLSLDINVVIFLHSTSDPTHDKNKKLSYLVDVFRHVDRIFVHTISDLNRLKNIGLIENVALFPHGIIDHDTNLLAHKKNIFLDNFNVRKIASFGFLLPHKGIKQLIEAISILKNQKFIVNLNLFHSTYSDDYLSFYDEVRELIQSLNLNNLVNLNTDYLSDNETLNLLEMNDLIVFPYQHTKESSSAAVRHGLATGKPVMVTPLEVFQDVASLVNFSSGISSLQLANSIREWYQSSQDVTSQDDREKRIREIKERSFENLGNRLSSILLSLYLSKNDVN